MKLLIITALTTLLSVSLQAEQTETSEKEMKKALMLCLEEIVTGFESVKNFESAENADKELEKLYKKLNKLTKDLYNSDTTMLMTRMTIQPVYSKKTNEYKIRMVLKLIEINEKMDVKIGNLLKPQILKWKLMSGC